MESKTATFAFTGSKDDAALAFAESLKAKDVYITRMQMDHVVTNHEQGEWNDVRWTIRYLTGRDAQKFDKRIKNAGVVA